MRCVVILSISLAAVLVGFFNRRWARACALLVLHIAIASFVWGCVNYMTSKEHCVASRSRMPATACDDGAHAS